MRTSGHKKQAAGFIFIFFSAIVMVISATTSFSFFYTYFGNLIPPGLVEDVVRRLISGLVGTLLFDFAAVIWLFTFLYHSETSEQRAVSLAMTLITFVGAAAASIAYLSLNASGEMALETSTKEVIAMVSLVAVIGGIIANFGAAQMHHRFSLESKQAVREADRRDMIQAAEEEQAKYLDSLIAQNMKQKLTDLAPTLAEEQASRLAEKFYRREDAKNEKAGQAKPAPKGKPRQQELKPFFAQEIPSTGQVEIVDVDHNKRPSK